MGPDRTIPKSYVVRRRADLFQNRRGNIIVLCIWLLLLLIMGIAGVRALCGEHAPTAYLTMSRLSYIGWAFALAALLAGNRCLHVWLHGLLIRRFTGKDPGYGFERAFVYARAEEYMTRRQFLAERLLPCLIQTLILTVLVLTLSDVWSPAAYITLAFHLAGCSEDYYFAYQAFAAPAGSLLEEGGLRVTVYGPASELPQ